MEYTEFDREIYLRQEIRTLEHNHYANSLGLGELLPDGSLASEHVKEQAKLEAKILKLRQELELVTAQRPPTRDELREQLLQGYRRDSQAWAEAERLGRENASKPAGGFRALTDKEQA